MSSLIPLGLHTDLSHARYKLTLSTGKQLILFRLPSLPSLNTQPATNSIDGWTYYAMESECPHAGGPMENAHVDIEDSSYIASCPWHAYDFDLETGESSYGVTACVFPIVIREDREVVLDFPGEVGVELESMEGVSEGVRFKHGARSKGKGGDGRVEKEFGEDATMVQWCVLILNTPDPERKIELTTQLFSAFATREGTANPMAIGAGVLSPPEEPPRSDLQEVKPWEMPNPGRGGTLKSRVLMLHALANIEQWAIDLAIDICVRFATFETIPRGSEEPQALPRAFYHDWLKVANDEAKHFSLLRSRLEDLGTTFGSLPVHHGLWESATLTKDDLRARISIIALVHEARGLDINPMTIAKFRRAGDAESVKTLTVIHNDEITHVTTGHRWLSWICEQEGRDPVEVFRGNVRRFFKGAVKGPFNEEARRETGMDRSWYEGLGGGPVRGHVVAGG